MLAEFVIHPSLASADLARAKAWYTEKLGWLPEREFDGLLVYAVEGRILTVYETPSAGTARNTVAIWRVDHLRAEVARLRGSGVVFEDYDFDDFKTVEGIATDDDGTLNAWFRDGDGNYISIVEPHLRPGDEMDDPSLRGVGAMIAASDLGRARSWYLERLGFVPWKEYEEQLLIYRSGKSQFSVYQTPSAGSAKNTVAVWRVADLRAEVADLRARGVVFEEYDFGDARTVDGILTDAEGDANAWFKDSEGNILALAQMRAGEDF